MRKNIWLVNASLKEHRFPIRSILTRWQNFKTLKEKAKFYYALFSESGFDEKIIDDAAENDTKLYSLEQIVHY